MYNVKFFLFYFFLWNSVLPSSETVFCEQRVPSLFTSLAVSPGHSGTFLAQIHLYIHAHTHTHTTLTYTHLKNEEIIMTTKQILCCPFVSLNVLKLELF